MLGLACGQVPLLLPGDKLGQVLGDKLGQVLGGKVGPAWVLGLDDIQVLVLGQGLDGKLELACELGLDGKLGRVCVLVVVVGGMGQACVLVVGDDMELVCMLELDELELVCELGEDGMVLVLVLGGMELELPHALHTIHQRHIQHNDQLYISHFVVFHPEVELSSVLKLLFHQNLLQPQSWFRHIHLERHKHNGMALVHTRVHDRLVWDGMLV